MPTNTVPTEKDWSLFINRHFQDFEELAETAHGWDLDFRQLQAGRSPADLLQFGSPDFVVTRFSMRQAYEQRGGTPLNMVTLGFIEEGVGDAFTSEGAITEDGLWCFSARREFAAVSRSEFRCWTLSLSESLIDEVAELCELSDARAAIGSGQIVRCHRRADIDGIRKRLAWISRDIRNGEMAMCHPRLAHELERDLVQEILEALADSSHIVRPLMTHRRRLVLHRAVDYLDANQNSPITVRELAQVAGAGLRTLEYLFNDYFGVTPKAYLTARRLVGVRRELLRSDAISTRVGIVANRWGFLHLSQFAKDYQRFFDELPSQTLQKR